MSRRILTLLLAIAPLSFLHAAESAVWDTANNTVTYSTSVSGIALGGGAVQADLSKFNSVAVAAEEGGDAAQYTLSRVILSIDGTIYGNIYFHNTGVAPVTPSFQLAGGQSSLAFGSHVTGTETFGEAVPIGSVVSGAEINQSINMQGSGAVSTPSITSDLASFTGTGTMATFVTINGNGYFSSAGTSFQNTVSVLGSANVSVTYEYVPEPSTLTLLGVGCVALLTRRRFKHPLCQTQGNVSSIS